MIQRSRPSITSPIPNPPFNRNGGVEKPKEDLPSGVTAAPQEPPAVEVVSSKEAPQKDVTIEETSRVKLARAKGEDGKFLPDDPSTPDVDEAWVLGVDS